MIEFLTDDGHWLDLDPETEFEITMGNPLLEADHISNTFSTSIGFPASPINREAFGYVAAMMMEPVIQTIGATLFMNGLPMIAGTLIYESIDNGVLNYTFSGIDYFEEWQKKIYEVEFLPSPSYPIIMNKAATTKTVYHHPSASVEPEVKYRNYGGAPSLPVVRIQHLLSYFGGLDMSECNLPDLAIMGLYKKTEGDTTTPESLPDRSFYEILVGILKLFCLAVFKDGNRYRAKSIKDVIENLTPLDWNDKVADSFSSSVEESTGYRLGYASEASDDVYDSDQMALDLGDGTITQTAPVETMLGVATNTYKAVHEMASGDVFSIKKITVDPSISYFSNQENDYLVDMLVHDNTPVDQEGKNGQVDASCDFHLVRCVPTVVYGSKHIPGTGSVGGAVYKHMVPVISFPKAGSERSSDVWIGVLAGRDFVDHGIYGSEESFNYTAPRIDIRTLFSTRHREFAAWLAKDRQKLTVSLNLTVCELYNYRLWQIVSVRNRRFLVSEMRIRLHATSSKAEINADLLSL